MLSRLGPPARRTVLILGATTLALGALAPTARAVTNNTISGTVSFGGAPASAACVDAFTSAPGDYTSSSSSSTLTNPDGTFTLSVPPARYHIHAAPCSATSTATAGWYNGTSSNTALAEGGAAPVDASSSNVSGLVMPLQQGGSIKGTVTTNNNGSIEPVGCNQVSATAQYDNAFTFYTQTATDGTFTLLGLPPGSYNVSYGTSDCSSGSYLQKYFQGTFDQSIALPVVVTPSGQATADIRLPKGGTITGTVLSKAGAPIANECVNVLPAGSNPYYGGYGYGYTAADGTYAVTGLSAGSWLVYTSDCPGNHNLTTYYADTTNPSAATAVNVSLNTTTPGITIHEIPAAVVTGTVTGAGVAMSGFCVNLVGVPDGQTGYYYSSFGGTTAPDGTFAAYVAPGKYKVQFEDCSSRNFVPRWNGAAVNRAAATPITISSSGASGVNADLAKGGRLVGTLTHLGQPVSGWCVDLINANKIGDTQGYTTTAPDGTWSLKGVLPTKYDIQFSACNSYPTTNYYYSPSGTAVSDIGSASPAPIVQAASGTSQTFNQIIP